MCATECRSKVSRGIFLCSFMGTLQGIHSCHRRHVLKSSETVGYKKCYNHVERVSCCLKAADFVEVVSDEALVGD